jgi:hypothetical protein
MWKRPGIRTKLRRQPTNPLNSCYEIVKLVDNFFLTRRPKPTQDCSADDDDDDDDDFFLAVFRTLKIQVF